MPIVKKGPTLRSRADWVACGLEEEMWHWTNHSSPGKKDNGPTVWLLATFGEFYLLESGTIVEVA
jgi:hypothetical protein